jgi:hypothetical protein
MVDAEKFGELIPEPEKQDDTPTETAGTQPRERRGTRGPLPETTDRVVTAIKDDIRTGHLTIKERRLFTGSKRAQQKYLTERYQCSSGTLHEARDIALLELETLKNSDKKTPTNSDETPTNSDNK